MDKKQITSFIKQVMGAYPSFTPEPERLEIWQRNLAQIDYKTAIERLDQYVTASKFPPTIADILNPDGVRKKKTDDICETTCSPYELYFPEGKPN